MSNTVSSKSQLRLVDGLFVAALAAHVPVGIEYARRMWNVGHYQFFPLLMLVAGWLIYSRVTRLPGVRQSSQTCALLAVNILLLAVSVLSYSPFLWIISFLFLVGVYVFDRWGKRGVMASLPAWLLFLFVVPLPSNLDLKLINQMQFIASQLASWVLDAFGQLHFREGVILVTEKKQFFTEEACSGVRSLFSSMAAISIYGVVNRYPLWRHLFNLVQTVIWVIVGNALRIAIVVYVSDNWTESIATGTAHEMLGLGVFLFIFALALSTDRALNAWQSDGLNRSADDILSDQVEEPVLEGSAINKSAHQRGSSEANPVFRLALIGLFTLLALFAVRLTWVKISGDILSYHSESDLLESLEADLPKTLNGWERVDFEHQMRDDTRLLAPESYLWTYTKGGRQVKISIDSPYYDFHNLNDCYAGFGWDVDFNHDYRIDEKTANAKNLTTLKMKKKNEAGVVYFSAYDRNGKLAIPRNDRNFAPTGWMKLRRNIRLALGMLTQENDPRMSKQPLPITQVQAIYRSGGELADLDDVEKLFTEARELLRKTERFNRTTN
jgi:exosortase